MEGDVRIVTFANGRVVPERIIGIDDANRRLAYASVDLPERKHHNASFQVFDRGPDASRLVWITDVLPDTLTDAFIQNMEKGLAVVKEHLEQGQ